VSRINKKLLYPHFKTLDDVKKNIKDIEGLDADEFFINNEWIQCKFYFKPNYWWEEGIKIWTP